jgi:hypothetical protein
MAVTFRRRPITTGRRPARISSCGHHNSNTHRDARPRRTTSTGKSANRRGLPHVLSCHVFFFFSFRPVPPRPASVWLAVRLAFQSARRHYAPPLRNARARAHLIVMCGERRRMQKKRKRASPTLPAPAGRGRHHTISENDFLIGTTCGDPAINGFCLTGGGSLSHLVWGFSHRLHSRRGRGKGYIVSTGRVGGG